jgi:hypothetical protein
MQPVFVVQLVENVKALVLDLANQLFDRIENDGKVLFVRELRKFGVVLSNQVVQTGGWFRITQVHTAAHVKGAHGGIFRRIDHYTANFCGSVCVNVVGPFKSEVHILENNT